jgi:extradiol dioxygenase family protein
MVVRPLGINHIAFQVRDLDEALAWYERFFAAALRAAGVPVRDSGSLRVTDPSGNQLEIVDYRDMQFAKTDAVLGAMGAGGLVKSESAIAELRDKGMAAE